MNKKPLKKTNSLWWLGIISLIIISRLPVFLLGFANIDENEYAIAAAKILRGGIPYKDFLIYQPPLIYYFYALAFFLFKSTELWTVHLFLYAIVIGSSYVLYRVTLESFQSVKGGLYSALFYGLLSVSFMPQDMLAANCEILAVLPTAMAIWCYLVATRRAGFQNDFEATAIYKLSTPYALPVVTLFFSSGFLAGLAFLAKYQCGIILAVLLIASLFIHKSIVAFLTILLGFLVTLALTLFFFFKTGALTEAWESLLYILKYAKGPPQIDPLYVIFKFGARTALLALAGLGIWYLALRSTVRNWRRSPLLTLWLALSFIPVILGGRIYPHYYFTVLPPLCVLAGGFYSTHRIKKRFKYFLISWSALALVGFMTYNMYKVLRPLTKKDDWLYAAHYLKSRSKPNQTLFVWGYCPQIYRESKVTPATRFTTADYLTGRNPSTPGLEYDPNKLPQPSSWQKMINDFKGSPGVVVYDTSSNIFPKAWNYLDQDFREALPTYIVDTSASNYAMYGRYPIANYPYLRDTIRQYYALVERMKGYAVYQKISSFDWPMYE